MDRRGQVPSCPPSSSHSAISSKKNSTGILPQFEQLWNECRPAFDQRRAVVAQLPAGAPVRAVMDDTLLRRSGLHTHGVAWRRDPLGPRFQTNFVRGQRFLQISASLPGNQGAFRMAPIAFLHAPTPPKPKRDASQADLAQYRLDVNASRLSLRGAEQMVALRRSLDQDAGSKLRILLLAF